MTNALEAQLYQSSTSIDVMKTASLSPYERGMFISFNNAKSDAYSLYSSVKRIYESIYLALKGEKISRDKIIVSTGKVPNRKRVMDMVYKKEPIMVAGIHQYNPFDQSSGRGSLNNYDEYHLHLYIYPVHYDLDKDDGEIRFQRLKAYLHRYLKAKKKLPSHAIDIRQVGIGEHLLNDVVTPTTIFDYLMMPYTNPEHVCVVNYIGETFTKKKEDRHPLYFIYQDI